MRVSYSPAYYAPLPEEHIFPMQKFQGLHSYLIEKDIIAEHQIVEPSPVDLTHLLSVHTLRYAKGVMDGTLEKKEIRRMGLPWTNQLAIRSRFAVQGTINAALMALQDGISANLAGGTHHAMPDQGEGFCVFNDVAVAIKILQQSMWARKILIIDCDVHQGNGTASIFKNNEDVYSFSIHGEKNYPFKKPPSTLDIGLPDNTGDSTYLNTLEDALNSVFNQFSPDLVFYLGGIDPLKDDYFGRLALTLNGLEMRERLIIEKVTALDIPLVLLMSGGYAPTLYDTVYAHSLMYKSAKEITG